MGYTSWICPDLDYVTLYSTDVFTNPDWSPCAEVRPIGFNIMTLYEEDLFEARSNGTDYDSGVIRLGRMYANSQLYDIYLFVRVQYDHATDRYKVTVGHTGPNPEGKTYEIDPDNYTTWPEWRKKIYIFRNKRRSSRLYADLPGFSGYYDYRIIFSSSTHLFVGHWETPEESGWAHGRMIYADVGIGDPSSVLLSIPCADDNTESRSQQSEGVFELDNSVSLYAGETADFHVGDYDGNYEEDADNPYDKDPNEEEDPPYGPGYGGGGGGNGDHILPDEGVDVPSLPPISLYDLSWLQLYEMTAAEFDAFGTQLTDPTFWQAISQYLNDPMEAIVGVTLIPYAAPVLGARIPHCGTNIWDTSYSICDQFFEVDCGNIDIPPYWDSAFDMDPYTKFQLFLPMIGFKPLNADEIMGAKLGVKYHVDVCTGDCIAFVTKTAPSGSIYGPFPSQVIAQYSGNCAIRVPLHRTSYDAAISSSMGIMGQALMFGGAIHGATFGSPASLASSQITAQVSGATMSAVNGMKTKTERSGNIAASSAYLSIMKPYLVRSIPQQVLPKNYQMLEGYPAQNAGTLAQYQDTGLNTVEAIRLTGFTGYQSEESEIMSILQGGVIV